MPNESNQTSKRNDINEVWSDPKPLQFPLNGRLKGGEKTNVPKSIEEVDKSNKRSLTNGDHGYSNDMS